MGVPALNNKQCPRHALSRVGKVKHWCKNVPWKISRLNSADEVGVFGPLSLFKECYFKFAFVIKARMIAIVDLNGLRGLLTSRYVHLEH
jgi:hypothetical protein